MERLLLAALGEQSIHPRIARPSLSLSSLDERTLHLQSHTIELSTTKAYATDARDYINSAFNFLFLLLLLPKLFHVILLILPFPLLQVPSTFLEPGIFLLIYILNLTPTAPIPLSLPPSEHQRNSM